MSYQIECIVKSVNIDKGNYVFGFEPTAKYQVEFDKKKIAFAVDITNECLKNISLDQLHDFEVPPTDSLVLDMLKFAALMGKQVKVMLETDEEGNVAIKGMNGNAG